MAFSHTWFNVVRRTFHKRSHRNITILHSPYPTDAEILRGETSIGLEDHIGSASPQNKQLTGEDIAAIKIQSLFRGHLARRAFRALRSLVKLQALVRGVYVRKQARIALHCMHALVRLQVRVRSRQILSR